MISVADYTIDFLVRKGVKDVFMVAGGGIMYLIDSVGRNKKINYIANHHEQASAIAAESYSRVTNNIGVCLVTTGPGGTNAITGVAGAWVDSIPILVISGQVKRELIADYEKVRQVGPQEINIVGMVKGITKYAKTIMDPNTIKYELEKAFYEAKNGRPGPAWLDIPLDVQGSMVDEKKLVGFTPPKIEKDKTLDKKIDKVISLLKESKRPVIIAGNGIRLAGAYELFREIIKKIGIPILTTVNGLDLVEENNKLFFGRFGPMGQRRANFVLQNSDLIISVGASLNIASTGFDFSNFAKKAIKVVVNIDKLELENRKIKIDLPLSMDVKAFLESFSKKLNGIFLKQNGSWIKICKYWKNKYSTVLNEFYKNKNCVNTYVFFKELSSVLDSKTVLTTGVGLDVVSFIQSFSVKKGQRAFVNKNFGSMGWDLPAVVGTCVASGFKKVFSVCGDGSVQLNIQELGTISFYKMPVKLFIFNNGGYKSIRDTQNSLFNSRLVGADFNTGVSNPNFRKLAQTYGLKYFIIKTNKELEFKLKKISSYNDPVLCEVNLDFNQQRIPKISTSRLKGGTLVSSSLENMFPFLPEKEVWKNMHFFNK